MITQISFPIINSDSIDFTSDVNMSKEEYENMVIDNFERNKHMMNDFEKYGFSIKGNDYYGVNKNNINDNNVNDCISYSKFEALVSNVNGGDMQYDELYTIADNESMSLINININPNSIEFDAESEVKLWIGESDGINFDKTLDNKTKFSSLPKRDIRVYIENSDKFIVLNNCKIVENRSSKNFPLNIIIIVEKITR